MLVGQSIGPFLIERELGSGAMGTVFRARYSGDDPRFLKELGGDTRVALKIIALGLSGNEMALARFEREAKILKQLRHPNIVRLHATGRWRDTPFFAMEYVDGQSLDRVMARRDRFSWEEVVQMGTQLCMALQHAHEKGIIHRDLKPSNLMITKSGDLKLTDFGIAKDVDVTALTGANNTIGTAAYMSPEQCKGEKNLTPKSDLYSLGVVFYELLTGRKPFHADSPVDMFLLHVQGTFTRPSQIVPSMPIWLDTLVCQLMEKKPDHRPRDAAMVAEALQSVATKMTEQKSAGEVVANARRVDVVHMTAPPDESDREATRAIKAGAKKKKVKKKKKSVAFFRQGWFLIVSIIAFLGASGFAFYLIMKPESPETLIQAIDQATNPDVKRKLIGDYLAAHGSKNDPQTERIRLLDRAEKVAKRERVLLNRYSKEALRQNPEEGEDVEAYRLTMSTLDAEAEGNITVAKDRWKELAEKYQNDPNPDKAMWGWVAAKKLDDLTSKFSAKEEQLIKKLEELRYYERNPTLESDAEGKALDAIRLEEFKDFTKARERWKRLKDELAKDVDQRFLFIVACRRERELAAKTEPKAENRAAHVRGLFDEAMNLSKLGDRPNRIKARYILRSVIDLYKGDIGGVAPVVTEAEKLLGELNKQ